MDIAILVSFLSPFLPQLLKFGRESVAAIPKGVSEAMGKQFGEAAWQKAQALWEKLHPEVEPAAIAKVAADPANPKRQAVLEVELEDLFAKNPDLEAAIASILEEPAPDGTSGTQIVQNVTGDKNITLGQMSGGNITIHND